MGAGEMELLRHCRRSVRVLSILVLGRPLDTARGILAGRRGGHAWPVSEILQAPSSIGPSAQPAAGFFFRAGEDGS